MIKNLLLAFLLLSVAPGSAADYNIINYGAVSDTTQLSTVAIQRAIDDCSANQGGRVIIPAGNYKTGTIILRSNVHLFFETGAVLYGSTNLKDYKEMKSDYQSLRTQTTTIQLIYADKVKNVTIDGNGMIDGQGSVFKKLSWNDEGITRPHLLRFIRSQDIVIKGITLKNSGCWMQHYLACDRVQLSDIKVFNRNNYNNDAIDIDGCHDVIINNVMADSDDDGITLKSTSPRLCENVVIQNCHESKRGTSAISLEITDGGVMENIMVSDILVEGTESPIFVRLGNRARGYAEGIPVTDIGRIKGVYLNNIVVNNAGPTGSSITGLPGHPVEDVYLRNIRITQQGGCGKVAIPTDEKEKEYPEATMWGVLPAKGFFVNHARNVVFENVEVETIKQDERPVFIKLDAE